MSRLRSLQNLTLPAIGDEDLSYLGTCGLALFFVPQAQPAFGSY